MPGYRGGQLPEPRRAPAAADDPGRWVPAGRPARQRSSSSMGSGTAAATTRLCSAAGGDARPQRFLRPDDGHARPGRLRHRGRSVGLELGGVPRRPRGVGLAPVGAGAPDEPDRADGRIARGVLGHHRDGRGTGDRGHLGGSAFADVGVLFDEIAVERGLPTWLRPGVIAWAKIIANDDLLARRPVDEVGKIGARPLAIVHGLADRPGDASREGSRRRARDVRPRLRALARPPGAPPPVRVRRTGRVRTTDRRVLPGKPRITHGALIVMNDLTTHPAFRSLVPPLLIVSILAGCAGPTFIPPGAQQVHLVVTGSEVPAWSRPRRAPATSISWSIRPGQR